MDLSDAQAGWCARMMRYRVQAFRVRRANDFGREPYYRRQGSLSAGLERWRMDSQCTGPDFGRERALNSSAIARSEALMHSDPAARLACRRRDVLAPKASCRSLAHGET